MTGRPGRPLRTLHVEANEDGTVGGSYRSLLDICRHLDPQAFEPSVLLYAPAGSGPAFREAGARQVLDWSAVRAGERRFSGPQPLLRRVQGVSAAVARRVRLLRRLQADVVHLNNAPGVGYDDWLPACRLLGLPCVSHMRGPLARARGRAGRALQDRFDRILPVSRWLQQEALAAGIAAARLEVVHDGVDVEAVQAAARRRPQDVRAALGLAPGDHVLLLAGHLRRWKGQHVAIEAMGALPDPLRRRTQLLLAGAAPPGDPYPEALRSRARALGVGERVHLLGARSDVPDLMRSADVVLHASIEPEPFGLVVVEALALGRPVVAAARGGPCETLAGGAGLLFDPDRAETLAEALAALAASPERRAALERGGPERARRFHVRRTVSRLAGILSQAAAGRGGDAAAGPGGDAAAGTHGRVGETSD